MGTACNPFFNISIFDVMGVYSRYSILSVWRFWISKSDDNFQTDTCIPFFISLRDANSTWPRINSLFYRIKILREPELLCSTHAKVH